MARMTDIDALLEKVAKIQASDGRQEKRVGEIILAITNAPTVEVVRCRDCFANECCSVQIDLDMGGDGYCPKGRRKTDG